MLSGEAAGRLIALVTLCLAGAIAVVMFVHANADPDQLWQGYYHDRNGHYLFGQDLALAIRTGDPQWFFSALEKAKVWPPLHGLVLAAVLLGRRHRSPAGDRSEPDRLDPHHHVRRGDRAGYARTARAKRRARRPRPWNRRRRDRGDARDREPRVPALRRQRHAGMPRCRPHGGGVVGLWPGHAPDGRGRCGR